MRIIPANEYLYAHRQHPRVLSDMDGLSYTSLESIMNSRMPFVTNGKTLYINTWIGRNPKYVLPGIGCTVEKLYEMHNEILQALLKRNLTLGVYNYIPSIDYSYYNTSIVDNLLLHINNGSRLILIDNGKVFSQQAVNFDFTPVIHELATEHKDYYFFTTHKSGLEDDLNVINLDEILDFQCNINEISYLSRFCDTVIGRCSGPHVFSQVLENWADKSKRLVSFTKTNFGSSFIRDSYNFNMKVRWSDATNFFNVFTFFNDIIKESRE